MAAKPYAESWPDGPIWPPTSRRDRYSDETMLAVVWHFWLGFFLAIGAVMTLVAVAVGYVVRVEMPRYPKKSE